MVLLMRFNTRHLPAEHLIFNGLNSWQALEDALEHLFPSPCATPSCQAGPAYGQRARSPSLRDVKTPCQNLSSTAVVNKNFKA